MAELYTISLEDQVTGNAYRIAKAYTDVSIAAQYLARSVKTADKDMQALDRHQLAQARVQLMAARAAQSAGNAIGRLGPKMNTATTATTKLTSAHGRATAGTVRFSYALNALAQSATNAAFSLVGRLAGAAMDAGKGLFDIADLASRAHMSFANFFGGQASGDRVLRESIEVARRYGFTIGDTVAQMQRFGAAGFSAENSKGLLRFGADMMAAGRSVQDVKGIFLAITQIQGKGKLQAEELTQQLAERGINAGRVWDILAKKLNTTRENVLKLQKAGKIGSGMAINAIVQAGVEGVRGSRIGEAGKVVADATVGGIARKMSTEIESQIFQAVDNATPRLVGGMQMIFAGLTGVEGGKLQDGLTEMLNQVGDFMGRVGPQLPALAENFSKAFSSASSFDGSSIKSFADQLPSIAADLGTIAGLFVTIASAAAKIAKFVIGPNKTEVGAIVENLKKSEYGNAPGLVSETGKSALDMWSENSLNGGLGKDVLKSDDLVSRDLDRALFKRGEELGASVPAGVKLSIDRDAPSVAESGENLAEDLIGAFAGPKGVDAHSPSKKFIRQGQYITEGLALGIDSNADLATHSTQMLAGAAVAASGASGLDPRRAVAAGSAAGAAMSARSSALTVRVGDVVIGGGGGGSSGGDAADSVREYFETEFVSMLERHLEGVGA